MERRSKILQLIKTENYVTYDELSEILQVSKKTIYNEIIALNDELSAFGAKIESKPRHGLILKISDKKAYEEYLSSLKEEQAENGNGDLRELSIAGGLGMMHKISSVVAFGGVVALPGVYEGALWYVVDMLIGALCIVAILFFTKPKLEEDLKTK